jgi:hypothetical protein
MAPSRIEMAKITAYEAQAKLLRQVVGRVLVVKTGEEIAVDRAAVALKEDLLGGGHRVRRTIMGLAQD